MSTPRRIFFAIPVLALGIWMGWRASADSTVADRLRALGPGAAATLTFQSAVFSDVLVGVYLADTSGAVRYRLANQQVEIDLFQTGRKTQFRLGQNAFEVTPDELTDSEFGRLRLFLGPLGFPLLPLDGILNAIQGEYSPVAPRQGQPALIFLPHPDFRKVLQSWIAFEGGMDAQSARRLTPETLVIRVPSENEKPVEIEQWDAMGRKIGRLTFDFHRQTPAPSLPPFEVPPQYPVIDGRSMMMAMGTDPQWLVGKSVPQGKIKQLDGREVALSRFKGRPMLINFWATWCGPCRIEWPVLQELYDRYRKNVDFILISPEDVPAVRRYIESNGYTAPVYVLSDQSVALALGINAFPSTFFVDPGGKIQKLYLGFPLYHSMDETRTALMDKYETALRYLLQENSPPKKSGG